MKKNLLILLLFSISATVFPDNFPEYPELPQYAKNLEGLIPEGWELYNKKTGDLNKDGHDDVVFVLQWADSIPPEYPDAMWSCAYSPRILGIALWNEKQNQFELEVQSNTFILTNEGDCTHKDPFDEVKIKRGSVWIEFSYWSSAGTWYMGADTFIFRYQNNQFELIGTEHTSTHRATLAHSKLSVNYSTRKAILFTQEDEEDKGTTRTLTFEHDKAFTFDDVLFPSFHNSNIDFGD